MEIFLLCLKIFFARILDVTLGTIRMVQTVKGRTIVAGIIAFSLAVLFQLATLPVEFDASNRAIRVLAGSGMLQGDEVRHTKKVLSAAALTYVASAASAILQLLRIVLIANRRRD